MTVDVSNPYWFMLELSSRIYSIRYITWANNESCIKPDVLALLLNSGISHNPGNVVYSNVIVHEMFILALEKLYMSLITRKQTFCICENKDADQLRGNREADQRLCFRYKDSTIPPLSKSEISSL